ncbi:MAG: ABC transporter permease [Herpetosiphonaceae bacterium]|nr:ABC transporter permease [Herpetosiphonaceae bacterium]
MRKSEPNVVRISLARRPSRTWSVNVGGEAWESVRIALESLRSNKLRTMLTMLGIIIGVWSVVSLLAIGGGASQSITDQVKGIGTNLLTVLPGTRARNNPKAYSGGAPSLSMNDVDAIRRTIPEISLVAPQFQNETQVVAGSINRSASILGITPEYATVRNIVMDDGQFISQQAVHSASLVAVLGSKTATDLYGPNDPIDQTLRIKGETFRVIGVLQSGGAISGYDSAVLIPISTAQKNLFGASGPQSSSFPVSLIAVQVKGSTDVDPGQADIELLMRRRHHLPESGDSDDFTVVNQATLLQTFNQVTNTLTAFLGAIAGISLLVGGIGVMNIMLVSVTERTREIGLRKAVGAKRRDILRQFLVEASVMSVMGGLIGVFVGYLTIALIKLVLSQFLQPVMTLGAVIMALTFSLLVGLFFGIYPARRAARLNPIQALRFD